MEEENINFNASILVVDDTEVNREVTQGILELVGCDVDAVNEYEALEALEKKPYDLIFMDIQMPGIDGHTLTRQIRNRDWPAKHTPIIALSANLLTPESKQKCKESGMNDLLSRPIERAVLERTLKFHLDARDQSDQSPQAKSW